jgi:hypothetical protein
MNWQDLYALRAEKERERFIPYTSEEAREMAGMIWPRDMKDEEGKPKNVEKRIRFVTVLHQYAQWHGMREKIHAEYMKTTAQRLREAADALEYD